jgi:hypothetical protein
MKITGVSMSCKMLLSTPVVNGPILLNISLLTLVILHKKEKSKMRITVSYVAC